MSSKDHNNTRESQNNKLRINVTAGLIRKEGKLLITRRPKGSHLAGLWEFPGGKQEPGETLEICMEREIREELGMDVRVKKLLLTVHHEYDTKAVDLHFFECETMKGSPKALDGQELRWVAPSDLKRYDFPPPDKRIVDLLAIQTLRIPPWDRTDQDHGL